VLLGLVAGVASQSACIVASVLVSATVTLVQVPARVVPMLVPARVVPVLVPLGLAQVLIFHLQLLIICNILDNNFFITNIISSIYQYKFK
jgi:hypothetical protein